MITEEFIDSCNWAAVRASALEHRAQVETRIAQEYAELRAHGGRVVVKFQERVAQLQDNIDAVDELLGALDARGL